MYCNWTRTLILQILYGIIALSSIVGKYSFYFPINIFCIWTVNLLELMVTQEEVSSDPYFTSYTTVVLLIIIK